MVSRRAVLTAVLGICLTGLGCGGAAKPTTSSTVKGVVYLNGEELTEGGTVSFASPATGNGAIAMVGPDGSFVVAGGMVPGDYKVTVTPPMPTPDHPDVKDSRVPEKYRTVEGSDLTQKISGGENELKLELKSDDKPEQKS